MYCYLLLKKYTPDIVKKIFNLWAADKEKELASIAKKRTIKTAKKKAKSTLRQIYQTGNLPINFDEIIENLKNILSYDDPEYIELIRIKKSYSHKKIAARKKPAAKKKVYTR